MVAVPVLAVVGVDTGARKTLVLSAELVLAAVAPACGYAGKSRPVVEYSGYTYFHLPAGDAPKNDVAKPAILAARMARSSLEIRRLLM